MHLENQEIARLNQADRPWPERLISALPNLELAKNPADLAAKKAELKTELQSKEQELAFLSPDDWDLLALLRNYDQETFDHSLKTLEIAQEKLTRPLADGTLLKELIEKEGVDLTTFYRACLFHDIGKTHIPLELLNSKATADQWARYFVELLPKTTQQQIFEQHNLTLPDDNEKAVQKILENDLRAVQYVPIQYDLDESLLKKLEQQELRSDLSLSQIIKKHEAESERILAILGYGDAALLAGAHHGYEKSSRDLLEEKPATTTSLRISTATASYIIHLADVQQALNSQRPYHEHQPMINILAKLVNQAKQGHIEPRITATWIFDEYVKLGSANIEAIRQKKSAGLTSTELDSQSEALAKVENFIAQYKISSK